MERKDLLQTVIVISVTNYKHGENDGDVSLK